MILSLLHRREFIEGFFCFSHTRHLQGSKKKGKAQIFVGFFVFKTSLATQQCHGYTTANIVG
jgi:hypothetical protein